MKPLQTEHTDYTLHKSLITFVFCDPMELIMTKKIILFCLATIIYLLPVFVYAQNAPKTIAGISIGQPVGDCERPTYSHYLEEKNVDLDNGFRKATISYGTCVHKNEILKIKMKYTDKSEMFFKDIYKELIEKYGKPDKWKGDSFGVLTIWKWLFTDSDDNMVSLSIEYNKKDPELSMGTVIKLSYPAKIEKERECDKAKRIYKESIEQSTTADWDDLLPH